MWNLKEYKNHPDRLADILPWAALIAPGIVLNKDGSFQRTLLFRGPDLESATEEQLVTVVARLNNALKRFGSGWVMYCEARREHYSSYPEEAAFPDPISLLIDAERRESFAAATTNFESKYYLTLQFLPVDQTTSQLGKLFISKPTMATIQTTTYNYQESLDLFTATTDRFMDILRDFMYEARFLNDSETLTYLHSAISEKTHIVESPAIPMYLDAFLADTPLSTGLKPKLGNKHICTISVLSFPTMTLPAFLDRLNQLPLCYRWVTRFISLDKIEAEVQLKRYKRRWFSKRKGLLNLLQEIFTKNESQLLDTAAIEKAKDADMALKELAEDFVSFGYYTATVTVAHEDLHVVEEMQREIERVINGLGFTTIAESFNAVEAWLSSLPGHAYANVRTPLLHSLNLAHLIPFSAVWSGLEKDSHLQAPALMYVQTPGRTPFRLVNHLGDVGHQMIIGPTGAGKSVLLTMMALQFRRYKNAQVFIFDKGGGFLAATHGVGGGYYELGGKVAGYEENQIEQSNYLHDYYRQGHDKLENYEKQKLSFQPLALIEQEKEKVWASEWVCGLLTNENIKITPDIKRVIWDALISLANMPKQQRTITGLSLLIQNNKLRQALAVYTLSGPFGFLLDADCERECDELWQCYETAELMTMPSVVAPVLLYIFHRLERLFTGSPTLLILDEAWLFLDHPLFAGQIRDWLKTLRKYNVSVVFATQSVTDALNTNIAAVLLESCPARIFLPNDRILEPLIRADYEKLGLNERQLQLLATAVPKLQYYYQSTAGNRLFNLELGPIAMAFCAASRTADKQLVRDCLHASGCNYQDFIKNYLTARQLTWAWQLVSC